MSYRQTSYDPFAYEQRGAPLRPYNWVQWTGVVIASLGIVGYLVVAADRLVWTHFGIDSAGPFVALPLFGVALINSRREPGRIFEGEEQLARNRRTLLITIAILAAVFGAALVIQFAGA